MLLIWERSPKGGRKRKMACSHSFSLLLRFVRPGNENPRILVLSRCGGESRHPSSSADSATGGVCLECSPRSFLLLLLLLPLLHLLLLLLAASHPSLPLLFSLPRAPPLWNILVLPSCTRVATANLTLWDYVSWDSVRAHTRASRGPVSRVQLVVSRSLSLSLSLRGALLPSLPWQVQLIFLFGIRVPPHRAQIMSRISVRYLSYAELRLRTGGREAFSSLDKDFCFGRCKKFPACRSRLHGVH